MKKMILSLLCLLSILNFASMQSYASDTGMTAGVIPVDMQMYTTSGTLVYTAPDLSAPVICTLERFIGVSVTGITTSGFYQVDLNGKFYIPGIYLIPSTTPQKSQKELTLEKIDKYAQAYTIILEQMKDYCFSFALVDINGDLVPELFASSGKEIYTYYEEHPVMIYYSDYGDQFFFSKSAKQLIGKYAWNKKDYYEVLGFDYSVLPWGQLKCISTDASVYKDMQAISYDYTNDAGTRNNLKNILKKKISS